MLRDLIKSGVIPTVRLDQIFRQDAKSAIVQAAHNILHGQMPDLPLPAAAKGRNFMFAGAADKEDAIRIAKTLICEKLPAAGFESKDIQILTPMREKGLGIHDLNPALQEALNPVAQGKNEVAAGKTPVGVRIFREGDRIMQIKNNYDKGVFNGDVGTIVGVSPAEPVGVAVKYPDMDDPVLYTPDEFDELLHAFASTVHKSQGAEYPCVVMILHDIHGNRMLQRNLFYTGITRGKKLVIVVGTRSAVGKAVNNSTQEERNTTLRQRLKSEAAKWKVA